MLEQDTSQTVTADDVAQKAGVSRWTVARAFKKDAPISASSRQRVMDAATALGYVPDLSASSLASDRSNLVAILVNDFENPHKLVMLERLTRILRVNGWGTLLVNMPDAADAPDALLTASQRRVDAAVLIGTQFDDKVLKTALGARRVKKLIVFARASRAENTISICCDDIGAMKQMADHVIARGYRRPLFLAGPDTDSAILMRKETFLRHWQDRVAGPAPDVLHVPHYNLAAPYTGVVDRLGAMAPDQWPDVIVCENDILAMGAMDAVRHGLGLSVPGDIAITGFDDIPLAAAPSYDITTIRQPITAMVETLLRVLGGEEQADRLFLPGKFLARSSTCGK